MSKKSKRKSIDKANPADLQTGFTKADWFGTGRRGRKQKKNKNKRPENSKLKPINIDEPC